MPGSERREVFSGNLIKVEVWPTRHREIVRHPGVCAVVPLLPDGRVVLVRQYRDALDATTLEIPAGTRDVEGEDAAGCARREVEEETGYRIRDMVQTASIHTSPGFLDERVELFLAEVDLEPASEPEEGVEVVTMHIGTAIDAISAGEITDGKTVVGLLLAAR